MTSFNTRLARLADAARALPDGDELARNLLRLVADLDFYLEQQQRERQTKYNAAFQKWNEFLNESVQAAYQDAAASLIRERRTCARRVAGDPRWQGGYADALALLDEETRGRAE